MARADLDDEDVIDDGSDAEVARAHAKEKGRRRSPLLFFRQVASELRKVVWPNRQQLVTYTSVVIVFVLVVMAFVQALDLGFGKLAFLVFSKNS